MPTVEEISASVVARYRADAAKGKASALEAYREAVRKMALGTALTPKETQKLEESIERLGFSPEFLGGDVAACRDHERYSKVVADTLSAGTSEQWNDRAVKATKAAEEYRRLAREEDGKAAVARARTGDFSVYQAALDTVIHGCPRMFSPDVATAVK